MPKDITPKFLVTPFKDAVVLDNEGFGQRIGGINGFGGTPATAVNKVIDNEGNLVSTYLTAIDSTKLNLADRGWTQTCVFSVTDLDTVSWGAGVYTASDGTAYSISAGNTGNMTARNYIYLDINVSTTTYQKTTTAVTAVGAGKVLIGSAINGTVEATFIIFSGDGSSNINGADIALGSITTNEILAHTIVAGNIAASTITGNEIAASTITGGKIAANTIVAGNIVAGAITANEISTGLYSQIDANLPSDVNLVGYWSFDEGKGLVANDGSGNGNNGTLTNMDDADWVAGVVGTALDFDGSNDYVVINDSLGVSLDGAAAIMMVAWVDNDDLPGAGDSRVIIQGAIHGVSTGFGLTLYNNDQIRVFGRSVSTDGFQAKAVSGFTTTGQQRCVVGVLDFVNKLIKIYLDGELLLSNSVTFANNSYTLGTPTSTTKIGASITPSLYFNGKIDEVRTYKAVPTDAEVYALYKNPAGNKGVMVPTGRLTSGSIYSKQITLAVADGTGDSYIAGGNALDLVNWRGGDANAGAFILGLDDSVAQNPAKFFLGNYSTSKYLQCDGTDISFVGGSMSIGSSNAIFKATADGIQLGHATFGSAPFRVTMAGAVVATSATISGAITMGAGSTLNADYINAGTLNVDRIEAGTIIAEKIGSDLTDANITSIDFDNITASNIDADTITAGTLTGLRFQTSANAQRGIKLEKEAYGAIADSYIEFWTNTGDVAYLYMRNSDAAIVFEASPVVFDGHILGESTSDIGASATKWRNLYLSGGIDMGADGYIKRAGTNYARLISSGVSLYKPLGLQHLSSAPGSASTYEGFMYFDTTQEDIVFSNGAGWYKVTATEI